MKILTETAMATVLVLNLGQLSPLSQLSPAKVYHHAACPMESAKSLADWSTKLTVLGET
jgi:hypothetical protein